MKLLNKLGGPDTYEHFPTGWAAAFSTPFQMFKRYSQYSGGTCDPLVISWPKGIKARGEVRNQYHHSTDFVPTILDIVGIEMPKVYRGVRAVPALRRLDALHASTPSPTRRRRRSASTTRCSARRGIWEDGWKAAAVHAPLTGKGHFDQDQWQLYHVDVDRAESKDLAKENPEKLQELIKAWYEEAEKNLVLPLDDRSALEVLGTARPSEEAVRERYVYYPGTAPVPEGVAVNVRGRSYKVLANVEITDAERRRRDLRPRLAVRRSRAVHQGPPAALRLQLPRHQARAAAGVVGTAQARQVHAGHGVHPREGGPERRVDRARPGSTSTTSWWPKDR